MNASDRYKVAGLAAHVARWSLGTLLSPAFSFAQATVSTFAEAYSTGKWANDGFGDGW